jgi:hypothetical protein
VESTHNEHFTYRTGILKKFAMSVLWLEIQKSREGARWIDMGAGIAAGIAMLFAVVATILQMQVMMFNSSEFVIAAVLVYILKDRIKDWLKVYFSNKMTGWLADYKAKIRDPLSDAVIGSCREAFSYLALNRVPPRVVQARHRDANSVIETTSRPEVVIKYQKDITLDTRALLSTHRRRRYDINDIIRFDISDFLAHTDDPTVESLYLNEVTDRVDRLQLPKVYHFNVVYVLSAKKKGATRSYFRVRVIIDRNGIRRIEIPEPAAGLG